MSFPVYSLFRCALTDFHVWNRLRVVLKRLSSIRSSLGGLTVYAQLADIYGSRPLRWQSYLTIPQHRGLRTIFCAYRCCDRMRTPLRRLARPSFKLVSHLPPVFCWVKFSKITVSGEPLFPTEGESAPPIQCPLRSRSGHLS